MKAAQSTTTPIRPSAGLMLAEQRSYKRASTRMHAAFKPQGYEARGSVISNISLGGAWLEMMDNQPAVGSEGKLHVIVGEMHLYLIAKVVRQTQHGIGVTFIDMGIETYENLRIIVDQLSQEKENPSP